MLANIHIKNLALIQEEEVDFHPGLNILTGETGAGKSILIGSVNVALGAKNFKDFVGDPEKSSSVELLFTIDQDSQKQSLQQLGVEPEDGMVILSRRLTGSRSISKINGETMPLSKIKEVAALLIDIHGQHEHQSLLSKKNHLTILDKYAKEELQDLPKQCYEQYLLLKKARKSWEEASMQDAQREKEMDFLRFEIEEIASANLKAGEDEELEIQYKKMENGKKIVEALTETYRFTGESSESAEESISRAMRSLGVVSEFDQVLGNLLEQLDEIDNLLNDFNREVSGYMDEFQFSDEDFQEVEERLNLINHLKAKYGSSILKILEYKKEKEQKLTQLEDYEHYLATLEQECKKQQKALQKAADQISDIRKKRAKRMTEEIVQALQDLNFIDVQFQVDVQKLKEAGSLGQDEVCFLVSMNPGQPLRPLQEVASGGELSRIMLALKSVLADQDETGTLIFDEIDVGISGRTAQKVSEKLGLIAKKHQVICITHLAQIAAMGDHHYLIEKQAKDAHTTTSIRKLNEEESVEELARILGGAQITERVMESAREMKQLAEKTKK